MSMSCTLLHRMKECLNRCTATCCKYMRAPAALGSVVYENGKKKPGLTVNGTQRKSTGRGSRGDAIRSHSWDNEHVLLSLLENPIPSHTLGHRVHRDCVQCSLTTSLTDSAPMDTSTVGHMGLPPHTQQVSNYQLRLQYHHSLHVLG
jgi:hypothetical protein